MPLTIAKEQGVDLAVGCSGAKTCPISGTPCPGDCIYADVMQSVSLGIVVFDTARGAVLFCNRWARELFASTGIDLSYEPLSALLLPPPAKDDDEERQSVVQPPPLRLGARFVGHTVYCAGDFAWVFVRDITEKMRLESIAEAVESTNNLAYVFSAVRHELGNPINSVKVAIGVLQQNLESYSRADIADYLDRMATEVGRVERLLRSLKSFSLFERPDPRSFQLGPFLTELLRLMRPELEARGVELDLVVEHASAAFCDARALHQVMLNLLTNAADAVAGRARARVEVRCTCSDALVTITVADNGVGIPAGQRAMLFKPFATTKESGTGLGLVIARKLLAAMGGTIAIDSVLDEGTTATVSLPCRSRGKRVSSHLPGDQC